MFCCPLSINFAKLMLFFDILEKKRQNESFGNVKIVSNKSIDLKKVKMNGGSRSFLLFNRANL